MIDIGKILKRAWSILWDYKALWIFGILLALTAGGGGGNGGNNSSRFNYSGDNSGSDFQDFDFGQATPALREFGEWLNQSVLPLFEHPEQYIGTFIWIGVAFFLLILVMSVIGTLIRYPSETAVMRMVDDYEQSGAKVSFKQGWKLGWSRRAFRIWLIDLLISVPAILFVLLLMGIGILVFATLDGGNPGQSFAGVGAAVLCLILVILPFVIVMAFLGLLRNLFVRAAALEETGVGASFRRGWELFKRNWKSVVVMWLVMIGVGIGYAIAGIIAFFLLIPLYIILLLPAAIVAAIPGLLVFGITSLFASSPITWIIAALAALLFFLLVVFAPLTFIEGLYMLYGSNVWTLTYRALIALEKPQIPSSETETPAVTN